MTVGKKGASINIGKDGVTGNAGIPGTGVSYREKLSGKSDSALGKAIVWLIVIGAVGAALGGASLEQVLATILSLLAARDSPTSA